MELRELGRVIRKRWVVALIGLALAIGLAVLTYENGPARKYTSNATVFVTQAGFPFANPPSTGASVNGAQLTSYAYLYSQIAQSDAIRAEIGAPLNAITATPLTTGAFGTGEGLPFIGLTVTASSPHEAQFLATHLTLALNRYIVDGENANHTPTTERVQLQTISAPQPGKAVASRRRVVILPAVVFITIILLTLGLLFMLENWSRREEEGAPEYEQRAAGSTPGAAGSTPGRSRWITGRPSVSDRVESKQPSGDFV